MSEPGTVWDQDFEKRAADEADLSKLSRAELERCTRALLTLMQAAHGIHDGGAIRISTRTPAGRRIGYVDEAREALGPLLDEASHRTSQRTIAMVQANLDARAARRQSA